MGAMGLGRLTVTTPGIRVAWLVFATLFATLNFVGNRAVERDPSREPLYEWSSAVSAIVMYAFIAAIMWFIARPLDPRVLGFSRPESWGRSLGYVGGGLVIIYVVLAATSPFLNAGKDQGLVPDHWDSSRAAPFIANFLVVAVIAPIVEEFSYRGVGLAVFRDMLGPVAAIVAVGLAFGLAHGLLIALPVLSIFGMILAYVRTKTESIYPAMLLHGVFNAISLLAGVALGVCG